MKSSTNIPSLWIPIVLLTLPLSFCSNEETSIIPVVREQLQRYPDIKVEDLYKLIHQAALGNAHLLEDEKESYRLLMEEANSIVADSSEPLFERISPNGRIVRVNLRSYLARRGDLDSLFAAMVSSSNAIPLDPERATEWCDEIIEEAAYGTIPQDVGTLRTYFKEMRERGYPAVHHSALYDSLYRPSYRVVAREYLPSLP